MDKDQAAMLAHLSAMFGITLDVLRHKGVLTDDDCRFIVNAVAEEVPNPSPVEDEFFTAMLRLALDQASRQPPPEEA